MLRENLGNTCSVCGLCFDIDYHHVVPLIEGGDNKLENIVPLCKSCHKDAHTKINNERKMMKFDWYVQAKEFLKEHEQWRQGYEKDRKDLYKNVAKILGEERVKKIKEEVKGGITCQT